MLAQGRDGNLYGTSPKGGAGSAGTVFKVTPTGNITTLHNFDRYTTGADSWAGLTLASDDNFYGTTVLGGSNDCGTIFRVTPSGSLTVLHNMGCSYYEAYPYAPPIQATNGVLYGVTDYGYAYRITLAGKFTLLPNPLPGYSGAPLIQAADGNLYGTTGSGGAYGYGSIFRMTLAGAVKIIYSFDNTHGSQPLGSVTQAADGNFYGTTQNGGANLGGVVFRMTPSGVFTVLHDFDFYTDGSYPDAGVVAASDGNFYGAAPVGGASGSGELFKLTKNGAFTGLYLFNDYSLGKYAVSQPMQHTNGTIYGMTNQGGLYDLGVFYSLNAGLSPFVVLLSSSGKLGQTVQILGQGFISTTSVMFGTGSANFTVVSDTYLTAVVPASGSTGYVTVTTPSGTLTSNKKFKVLPVITDFSPTSGSVGTQVTITGSGFIGATKVTFGGVKATSYTVNSGTQITATVPTGAKTGKIAVTTPGGTASKGTFTVS